MLSALLLAVVSEKNQFLYSHYFWCDFSLMAPVYISSVILGELLNIFVSQSPHL